MVLNFIIYIKFIIIIQNLRFIDVLINDIKAQAHLDTGSELSLVQEKFINDNLNLFKKEIVHIKKVNLISPNNKKITTSTLSKLINVKLRLCFGFVQF